MSFDDQNVLVTGGAGVIGSVLIQRLVNAGARVLCCDLKPKPSDLPAGVQYLQGDANYLTLETLLAFSPSYVFHLAATFERSMETEEFWEENYHHNIRLSNHLMSLVKRVPSVRRVVFASSYLIYDPTLYSFAEAQTSPRLLREDTPIYPRNICGAAKLLHELELRFLEEFESSRFTTISARIFRVYGRKSQDIVSRWVRTLVAAPNAQLSIYRGEGIFDYIFADDVAEGLLRLGVSTGTGISNLGSGQGRSVFELIEVLRHHFPSLRTQVVEADIPYEAHQAELSRLQTLTGWSPNTSLEDGVATLVRFYQSNEVELARDQAEGSVLISSAARKVPLLRAYQAASLHLATQVNVIAGDLNPDCIAGHFANETWAMPRLDQLSVAALVSACQRREVNLIVPTRDGELLYYARAKAELAAAGIFVPIAAEVTIERCLDKLMFSRTCEDAGVTVIETRTHLEEFEDITSFVVKERFGAGARTIGLRLSAAAAKRHAATLTEPIFQPFVEGDEYSVDLYVNREGEVVEVVPRRRSQVFNGESAVSETVESRALVQASIHLAEQLELRGHNVLQAFVQAGQEVIFIECNPRVGGASSLSFAAGLNSPAWSMIEAAGGSVTPCLGSYRRGLKLIRYSQDRFIAT